MKKTIKNNVDSNSHNAGNANWSIKDIFGIAVRPVRITLTHAGRSLKSAFNSVGTFNPVKKEFWSAENYSKDKMIDAFDSMTTASTSALAIGVAAGIAVVGSPALGGAAYLGLNTQLDDEQSNWSVDKKFEAFMKKNAPKEGSLQQQFFKFAGKPINVAKATYNDAIQDLRDGRYLAAGYGLAITGLMGLVMKSASLAAMSSLGRAFAVYSSAAAATNAVFRVMPKPEEASSELAAIDANAAVSTTMLEGQIPHAVINPQGPDAHLLEQAPQNIATPAPAAPAM
jgi:hypothetical protein